MSKRFPLATLALSASGIVAIALSEGFVGRAYQDIVGVWTIGFGTTQDVKPGDTITVEKALERKLEDTRRFHEGMASCVTTPITQLEYDAYLSLAYNIGTQKFCGSTLVRKLNAGDYEGACKEILRWNRAGGRVVKGLMIRREAEYEKCMEGVKNAMD